MLGASAITGEAARAESDSTASSKSADVACSGQRHGRGEQAQHEASEQRTQGRSALQLHSAHRSNASEVSHEEIRQDGEIDGLIPTAGH